MNLNEVVLQVTNLKMGYAVGTGHRSRVLPAVDGVGFEIRAGETLALVGESGCGKSATALSILRLLPPAGRILGGEVHFEGQELLSMSAAQIRKLRGHGISMIFQEPATSLNPVMTVGQQIGEVIASQAMKAPRDVRGNALELLQAVGIADAERRLDEYPFQLSGGMKQRVMIAIALAGNPRLLIADEPTTALDVTIQAQILDLLLELQHQRGMAILLITHDLGVVAKMAHRVAVMYAGETVEQANAMSFFTRPRHPYSQKLFAALPDSSRRGLNLETIAGHVPSLAKMPKGCRFSERCTHVQEICRTESPDWFLPHETHFVRCHWVQNEGKDVEQVPLGAVAAQVTSIAATQLPNLLQVENLQVHFPIRRGFFQQTVGAVKAVDGVSFEIARGKTLALVGESGCGKTTVGKAILKLIQPTGGKVVVDSGEAVNAPALTLQALRQKMQMVFQDPFASLNPRMPIGEIINEGLCALKPTLNAGERKAIVDKLLSAVGLPPEAIHRFPHEFSGGQRQRIAIARALAVEPELIICDEPTSALDVSVQAQILNLLRSLQAKLGVAYLFITHNFAVVEYLADDVAVMYLGRIVEKGSVQDVLERAKHPYTQALLSAVPEAKLATRHVIRLSGEMPSPSKPPKGCHFHPRCPQALDICRVNYPEERSAAVGHVVRCHLVAP